MDNLLRADMSLNLKLLVLVLMDCLFLEVITETPEFLSVPERLRF